MPALPDYYDILGVAADADAKTIKAAYRELAKRLHPDRGGSAAAVARVNEAADVLLDANRRAAYDLERRQSPGGTGSKARPTTNAPTGGTSTQKRTVALCEACGRLNRLKRDNPSPLCGVCGHGWGQPLPGREPATPPKTRDTGASQPQDSWGQLWGDIQTQVKDHLKGAGEGGRLSVGLRKAEQQLRRMADELKAQADRLDQTAPPSTTGDAGSSRFDEFDRFARKMDP